MIGSATRFDASPAAMADELSLARQANRVIADMFPRRLPVVDVDADGHEILISVADVRGATGVEVSAAEVRVGYGELLENVASVDVSTPGSKTDRVVRVPPHRRLRSLTLAGLKHGGVALENAGAFVAHLKIAVSLPDPRGGWQAPLVTVPEVGSRGMLPPSMRGASFVNRVLRLPDPQADRVRITIVDAQFPEDFTEREFELGTVSGQVVTGPLDLELLDPGGRSLFAYPGELPESGEDTSIDVRVPLELALSEQAGKGAPLRAVFKLRASSACRAGLSLPTPAITVVREQPGVLAVTLAGEGAAPVLEGAPLADEVPSAARADLRVRYDGLRVLEAPRDPLPARGGRLAGSIVGPEPVPRALPPQVFEQFAPVRLGLVGRAPEACELSVWLAAAGTLASLCAPGILSLQPAEQFALHWVQLPELQAPLAPAVIVARATTGRFLWAGESEPHIQIVVRDPDPGGRAVKIAGLPLTHCVQPDVRTLAATLPAAAFRSAPPLLESDLFVTVELGDLRLEYAR